MKNIDTTFEDFENETLSKKQQKTVRGGDGETDPKEPGKGGGGNGNG